MYSRRQQHHPVVNSGKILLIFIGIGLVGLFKGCNDVSFAVSGKKTEARMMKTSKITGRRGSESSMKHVRYKWTDEDGNECIGYDKVHLAWEGPDDRVLPIVYIPGKLEVDRKNTVSRLQESGSWTGLTMIFVGFFGTIGAYFFMVRTMEDTPAE